MPDAFAARDVWLFSSGPLGDPPMPGGEPDDTEPMLDRTHAREHRTFAGRIVRDELRFGEKAITKLVGVPEGDFIPRGEIRSWASEIARTILREAEGQGPLSSGPVRPSGESRPSFTPAEASVVAERLGVTFDRFDLDQLRQGMDVELEHGLQDAATNVTGDDPMTTGRIALAHLLEVPDYYTRLGVMEAWARPAN